MNAKNVDTIILDLRKKVEKVKDFGDWEAYRAHSEKNSVDDFGLVSGYGDEVIKFDSSEGEPLIDVLEFIDSASPENILTLLHYISDLQNHIISLEDNM